MGLRDLRHSSWAFGGLREVAEPLHCVFVLEADGSQPDTVPMALAIEWGPPAYPQSPSRQSQNWRWV